MSKGWRGRCRDSGVCAGWPVAGPWGAYQGAHSCLTVATFLGYLAAHLSLTCSPPALATLLLKYLWFGQADGDPCGSVALRTNKASSLKVRVCWRSRALPRGLPGGPWWKPSIPCAVTSIQSAWNGLFVYSGLVSVPSAGR